jgi:hypothetical protein
MNLERFIDFTQGKYKFGSNHHTGGDWNGEDRRELPSEFFW